MKNTESAGISGRRLFGEPERYRKDVPDAQVHVLDAGHFALDTAAEEIAALVRNFADSSRGGLPARRAD
jgi:pimeloyl-ACP methyl ester carboxylesterase